MKDYIAYGIKNAFRIKRLLGLEGLEQLPTTCEAFSRLENWLRKLIAGHLPLVLSDNYEHFMACLPGKRYAGQIGDFRPAFQRFLTSFFFQVRSKARYCV